MGIAIKRVYDKPEEKDGTRILVDRLWPRGLTKEKAKIALWIKEVAPSTELRKWFGHDPARWKEFQTRYEHELKGKDEALSLITREAAKGQITLVYGSKDEAHNDAIVLQKNLLQRSRKRVAS
jgi:uncharacterized protein YeaO (DUF488 family)